MEEILPIVEFLDRSGDFIKLPDEKFQMIHLVFLMYMHIFLSDVIIPFGSMAVVEKSASSGYSYVIYL